MIENTIVCNSRRQPQDVALKRGADPNDEETAYQVIETRRHGAANSARQRQTERAQHGHLASALMQLA
jgi:hypothetical protein